MKTYYVYSHCFGGTIQQDYTGTRYKCLAWVRRMVCVGRPTHFYFISSLGYEKAKRRYAKGI